MKSKNHPPKPKRRTIETEVAFVDYTFDVMDWYSPDEACDNLRALFKAKLVNYKPTTESSKLKLHIHTYHDSEPSISIIEVRPQTDEEYQKDLDLWKAEKKKITDKEYQQYLELKRKFENA
jgi:hypothetical protein